MIGWRLLCAGLLLVAVATTAAASLSVLAGNLSTSSAGIAILAGALAATLAYTHARAPRQTMTTTDIVVLAFFALVSARAFLWLIYADAGEWKVLSPYNLGDMALHLNLIHRWANGGTFWPDNPFIAGAAFAYHPGMDLWNALLRTLGVQVFEGLRWTGLLGAAAAAAALWRWGGGFAAAAFLLAGGFGFLDPMQSNLAWKNPFLAMFVTQRGLLYSLPAGLVLLTVWRAQLDKTGGPTLPVTAQAGLYAAMPLFNAPAFLFLSLVLAACIVVGWRKNLARPFIVTALLSIIPAACLVHLVTSGFSAPTPFRFAPGWMQDDGGLWFWMINFGIFLPFMVVLGVTVFRRPEATDSTRVMYWTGIATLAFCFLFQLAPWAWDNTKLILWGYLAMAPILWRELLAHWRPWAQGVACLTLFASGGSALLAGLDARHGYKLADRSELAEVQVMLRKTPVNARLACAPSYEHPALLLGQPVVMGYAGHLYSQGIDYAPIEKDLDRLMSGKNDWTQAARSLGVHYVFWGIREAQRWPDSTQPWKSCGRLLAASKHGDLYQITPCLLED
jgi:hypothetical protein